LKHKIDLYTCTRSIDGATQRTVKRSETANGKMRICGRADADTGKCGGADF